MEQRLLTSPPVRLLCATILPCVVLASCTASSQSATISVDAELIVEGPERGEFDDDGRVTIHGYVEKPENVKRVRVADRSVEVGTSGRFSIDVSLPPGLNLVHTELETRSGETHRDTRAVMAGPFSAPGALATTSVVASFDSLNVATLGDAVAQLLSTRDFAELLAAHSPSFQTGGGCFFANARLASLESDNISVATFPIAGGVGFDLRLSEITGTIDASYRSGCVDSSRSVDFHAEKYDLSGVLSVNARDGAIELEIDTGESRIDDFAISFTGNEFLDEALTNLDWLAGPALGWLAKTELAPAFEASLRDFAGRERQIDVLDHSFTLRASPTALDFSESGAEIELASTIYAAGVASPGYPLTAIDTPLSAMPKPQSGLDIRVSDEVFHQAFTAMWSTGAFHRMIDPRSLGANTFGDQLHTIEVEALLPPAVVFREADDLPTLLIGDVLVSLRGTNRVHATVSLSAKISLEVAAGLSLDSNSTTIAPTVRVEESWIDVLSIHPQSREILDEELLAAVVEAALGTVAKNAGGGFQLVVLPIFAGTTLAKPSIQTRPGTLVIGGELIVAE